MSPISPVKVSTWPFHLAFYILQIWVSLITFKRLTAAFDYDRQSFVHHPALSLLLLLHHLYQLISCFVFIQCFVSENQKQWTKILSYSFWTMRDTTWSDLSTWFAPSQHNRKSYSNAATALAGKVLFLSFCTYFAFFYLWFWLFHFLFCFIVLPQEHFFFTSHQLYCRIVAELQLVLSCVFTKVSNNRKKY